MESLISMGKSINGPVEIVDYLHIKNDDFDSYVSLPGGNTLVSRGPMTQRTPP